MSRLCLVAILFTSACFTPAQLPVMKDDVPDQGKQDPSLALSDAEEIAQQDASLTREPFALRVATFNASMFRDTSGRLIDDLRAGEDEHIRAVAHVIQEVRLDIVLVNKFDRDEAGEAAALFQTFLRDEAASPGLETIDYPHFFQPETNIVWVCSVCSRCERIEELLGSF